MKIIKTTAIQTLKLEMMDYYRNDPKRINHFLKVFDFSSIIGIEEKLSEDEQFLLEAAALVHDIGIKESERKFGNANGKNQETEGPPIAEKMLEKIGFDKEIIEKICYLIAHHHTYDNIDTLPYQILVEADFIVNAYEDSLHRDSIRTMRDRIFKTNCGKDILERLYL